MKRKRDNEKKTMREREDIRGVGREIEIERKDGAVWRELCAQDLTAAVTFGRQTQPA